MENLGPKGELNIELVAVAAPEHIRSADWSIGADTKALVQEKWHLHTKKQ